MPANARHLNKPFRLILTSQFIVALIDFLQTFWLNASRNRTQFFIIICMYFLSVVHSYSPFCIFSQLKIMKSFWKQTRSQNYAPATQFVWLPSTHCIEVNRVDAKKKKLINKLHSWPVPPRIWRKNVSRHRIGLSALQSNGDKICIPTAFYLSWSNAGFFFPRAVCMFVIIVIIIGTDVCFSNYCKTGCYAFAWTNNQLNKQYFPLSFRALPF